MKQGALSFFAAAAVVATNNFESSPSVSRSEVDDALAGSEDG